MERKQQTELTVQAQRTIAVLEVKLLQAHATARDSQDRLCDVEIERTKQLYDIAAERRQQVDA